MGFYTGITIECVNPNKFYAWPTPRDLGCAELVSRHAVLTSLQLQKLGYPSRILSRLVKRGVLYRYKVQTPEGTLPSIYTAGYTAQLISKMPVPRFPHIEDLRPLLMINQVMVSILLQTEARVSVKIHRPVQVITVNNPLGILVANDENYPQIPLRHNLKQAIAILPNKNLSLPDIPFRYVLEEELSHDSFDIQYYYRGEKGLVPVEISFEQKEQQIENHSREPARIAK